MKSSAHITVKMITFGKYEKLDYPVFCYFETYVFDSFRVKSSKELNSKI
jgi:hypothetical protein